MSPLDEILANLERLVATRTAYPPGDTTALSAWVVPQLAAAGFRTAVHARTPGLANIVASIGSGAPHLVFNGHADTVDAAEGWTTDPFRLTRRGDRVAGLGASNCKGPIAVHLWLAAEIARRGGLQRGTVSFALVTDEENIGPDGTAYLREAGLLRPNMLVVAAPTNNALITRERGVMWVEVETRGKAAHAGLTSEGDNAILRMVRLIGRLAADLLPRIEGRRADGLQATLNVGQIAGGTNTNVVPARARVEIDRRLLPSETVEGAFAEIRDCLARAGEPEGSWTAALMRGTPGYATARDRPLVQAIAGATREATGRDPAFIDSVGASDGRYYASDGIDIVAFGPGSGEEGHAANETISVAELEDAAAIHLALVRRLNGLAR